MPDLTKTKIVSKIKEWNSSEQTIQSLLDSIEFKLFKKKNPNQSSNSNINQNSNELMSEEEENSIDGEEEIEIDDKIINQDQNPQRRKKLKVKRK